MKCSCGKEIHPNKHHIDNIIFEREGTCEECFENSKELIKTEKGYYVPWSYRYYTDSQQLMPPEYFEEVNMDFPKISWCNKHKKWKLSCSGADSGGYEAERFEVYFDTKEEIFALMEKE